MNRMRRSCSRPTRSGGVKPKHNLTEVVFTPIKSGATRIAALLSGQVDMIFPVPPQDVARIEHTAGYKIFQGPELRTVFIGMDQGRDELLESSVKGKNPFKDIRVRRAISMAIDVEAIRQKVMGGQSSAQWLDDRAQHQRVRSDDRSSPCLTIRWPQRSS